jgi:hypothetical protein
LPHWVQKRAPAASFAPQAGQAAPPSAVPQSGQNRPLDSVLQFGQRIGGES